MRNKPITILALCLATLVSQAPVASAQVVSSGGYVTASYKCC